MKDGHLKICGLELGRWKKANDLGRDVYERYVVHGSNTFRDLKIRLFCSSGVWKMNCWDEITMVEQIEQWNYTTIGDVDHGIVLDAADEFLERLEKLRPFE